jgi:hypothetical protein
MLQWQQAGILASHPNARIRLQSYLEAGLQCGKKGWPPVGPREPRTGRPTIYIEV